MKILNVKVWTWISGILVTLGGLASFVGAEAGAKMTYGSAISGSELYNLTTDQAGWSLAVIAIGLTIISIAVLTRGVMRAKMAIALGLIFTIENLVAVIYSSGRHAKNPTAIVIITLLVPIITVISGWVNKNNSNA